MSDAAPDAAEGTSLGRDRRDEVIAKLSADLEALREHKDLEVATVREEMQVRYDELRGEMERLQERLDDVYASTTWKVGRAVLWLPRKMSGTKQPPTEGRSDASRR